MNVEDVSRRNAIDTVTGWMALHGIAGADKVLGLTATSHDLAQQLGMTLFGHAAPGRYICYAGVERFDARF